ncbi:hypothetical protein GCM10009682_15550 [Luedemannella flava]|uniref:ABC transporter n=1 Tax=Luedemannella flava TaxID=349316 RepID=A0ABP4XX15_9ACTN
MTALVRYSLSMLVRSQGYIAPFVLFGSAVVVLTTNDFGPIAGTYSACALIQFVCMLWFTVAIVNTEDRTQRSLTVVAAGGQRRVLVANVLAATVVCVGLSAVGLVYPIYAGTHDVAPADLAVGALAQLTCGFAGTAAGLLCSRLVIPKAGYAVFASLAAIGVMTMVRPVPPVGPVMALLSSATAPDRMLGPVAAMGALSVVMLVASVLVAELIVRQQD